MARFVTITNTNTSDWGKRKRTIDSPKKVGHITATFMLGFLICVIGVAYIFQVNRVATMGYEIRKQENQIEELKQQNERLKIKAAELKSIYNIETGKAEMEMLKPTEVSYVEVQNPVAMK